MSTPDVTLFDRAVEILCCYFDAATQEKKWSVSSGFLVGDLWVITAAHAVSIGLGSRQQGEILVRLPTFQCELPALLVAIGDQRSDLAILKIESLPFATLPSRVHFAHIDRTFPAQLPNLWAAGYPRFKERPAQDTATRSLRESEHVTGSINPGSNAVSGLLSFRVESTPSASKPPMNTSQWEGMSGALVFYLADERPLCVGVVTEHAPSEGPSTLTVTPIARLTELRPVLDRELRAAQLALRAESSHEWSSLKAALPYTQLIDPTARPDGSSVATPVARRGLPATLANEIFVGRADELNRLGRYLTNADEHAAIRAVLLAGPPGVGKTALATESSKRVRSLFGGGVIFINLHGYDPHRSVSTDQVLAAILRAIGVSAIHIPTTVEEKLDRYEKEAERIAAEEGPILIVLDNVARSEQIRTLLPPAPHKLLVTSRHTHAHVPGGRLVDVGVLSFAESRDLVSRVLAITRDHDRRAVLEEHALKELIELCGRLPLALRISAALLGSEAEMSVSELVRELADERSRLEKFAYDDLAVRISLQLSYNYLSAGLRHVFRMLGLHPGRHLSPESIAVLSSSGSLDVKLALEGLEKANLIERGALPGWTRLHDLIRIYAAERAAVEVDRNEIQQSLVRLINHYDSRTTEVGRSIDEVHSEQRSSALAWMDDERTSVIATAEAAEESGLSDQAYTLCLNLAGYLRLRARASDWEGTARLAGRVAATMDAARGGRAAANLAEGLWATRKFTESLTFHERAVALLAGTQDIAGLISAFTGLGRALWGLGNIERSLEVLQNAVELAEQQKDLRRLGAALAVQGNTLGEQGRVQDAVLCQERAASMFHESELSHDRAHVLVNLASSYWRLGVSSKALQLLKEATSMMLDTGDLFGYALTLTSHANACAGLGDFEKSADLHRLANKIFRDIGDQYGVGRSWQNLSKVLEQSGNATDAAEYRHRSMGILARYEHQHGHTVAVIRLGSKPGERWEPHAH